MVGPGHDNKLHPHRVLALYDIVVNGPLSNHSIQFFFMACTESCSLVMYTGATLGVTTTRNNV
jgi:hypothetical protein